MNASEHRRHIKERFFPGMYSRIVAEDDDEFLLGDGRYLFLCTPISRLNLSDTRNRELKRRVARQVKALPLIREFGLFVHTYGPEADWREAARHLRVDKTAMRPVIVQNIHFLDPDTGASFNNRTAWGPLRFGFCGKVVEELEALAAGIRATD